ncbi:MarR family transcriptional regulator [Pseudonocardia yuanmonensis]|uniref:MarR family transcriptional regulator n=1 Tax=Pseudonocardia yuanmonensis TaxID=1095914 RepID=A0ABP8W3B5_9PSEU
MDPDDAGVAAWAALLRTHAAVLRELERDMERSQGMPLTWYDVLLELGSAPDRRLRMQELGERAVVSRSRVSRIVDELVRAGLVVREQDPADRRGSWAVLTPAGRERLRAAAPGYLDGIGRHFADHLTPEERDAITAGLQRVLAAHAAERPGPR